VTCEGGWPGAGAAGGDGGWIEVAGSGALSTLAGPLSVKGAAGTPAGAHGTVRVDGNPQPLAGGVFTP